jgi:hypothetical protein
MFQLKNYSVPNIKIITLMNNPNQHQTQSLIEGPTGPSGKDGDRFCTKTINKTSIQPTSNSLLILQVETGLAYISGNSVIVAEVADSLMSELNTFEATVHYYNPKSGQLILKDIVNIHGEFSIEPNFYHVNLDGVDGAPGAEGPQGPTGIQGPKGIQGPTGPSNISSTTTFLDLIDNSIKIPYQLTPITYYTINLNNTDEIKLIESLLTSNQLAIILIKLMDIDENPDSIATIYPIPNINTNYNTNIILNNDIQYAIYTIYNIEGLNFGECITYYKN